MARSSIPITIFLLAAVCLFVGLQLPLLKSNMELDLWQTLPSNNNPCPEQQQQSNSLALDIVKKAYQSSYQILETNCARNQTFRHCIDRLQTQSQVLNTPWWFRTLLRDALSGGLHGGWHNKTIENPQLRFCSIEKIGSTEWKIWQCHLNGKYGPGYTPHVKGTQAYCEPLPNVTVPLTAPRAVFLRDPLERFLSAFVDKCIKDTDQQHCQPVSIFTPPKNLIKPDTRIKATLQELNLVQDMDPPTLFEAYVFAFPLSWNVHFFPQSLYCDGLYRHLDTYDFIGHMGPTFVQDLHAMGRKYGPRLHQALEFAFRLGPNATAPKLRRNRTSASQVSKFYTPRTLRRVLEYVSVDYLKLGLPIPEWAEEMLQRDDLV